MLYAVESVVKTDPNCYKGVYRKALAEFQLDNFDIAIKTLKPFIKQK